MRTGLGRYVPHLATSFVPTDITGCQLWLDASDTSTITASSGSVSQWNDLSGNARHATQGSAGSQPTTGTRTQNSLNVLDFTPADWMTCALAGNPTNETVFAVALIDSLAAARTLLCGDANGTRHYYVTTAGKQKLSRYFTADVGEGTAVASTATPYVFVLKRANAGSWLFRRNAAADGNGTSGESYASSTNTLIGAGPGNLFAWDGWMGEIVVYDSILSTTDTDTVEAYLNDKWAVY